MKKNLYLILLFSQILTFGQNTECCTTYVYEGWIETEKTKLEINLNFLVFLDSTMVGSYHYNPKLGSLKLAGKLRSNKTFSMNERDSTGTITGFFQGEITRDFNEAKGIWKNADATENYAFSLIQVFGKSYWDYIKKNRVLYEYNSIGKAIRKKRKVFSIDVANQNLDTLPNDLSKLEKIVSINLLGNKFSKFPVVLSNLSTLDEISLSSNKINVIGSEIGKLKNLRILILNNNFITSLPKEFGELTNLLYLELGNNQISSFPNEFQKLMNLQELHIERNKLSDSEKKRLKKLLPNCIIHF